MIPILTNVGRVLNFDGYRVIIPAVRAMRKTAKLMRKAGRWLDSESWRLDDKSYRIVPAICQECFDRVEEIPDCPACSNLALE